MIMSLTTAKPFLVRMMMMGRTFGSRNLTLIISRRFIPANRLNNSLSLWSCPLETRKNIWIAILSLKTVKHLPWTLSLPQDYRIQKTFLAKILRGGGDMLHEWGHQYLVYFMKKSNIYKVPSLGSALMSLRVNLNLFHLSKVHHTRGIFYFRSLNVNCFIHFAIF